MSAVECDVPPSPKHSKELKPLPTAVHFLNGGLAGICATFLLHPMDVLKNRMQMSRGGISVMRVCKNIFRFEGIITFYVGLSAGLMRQATYSSSRLGIYNHFVDMYSERFPDEDPPFGILALMAATSGSFSAFLGTPVEVALVRMTSDGRLPSEYRRHYMNVYDALVRIVKEEGGSVLWRGSGATVARAAVVNASQLATYYEAKLLIATKFKVEEGFALHVYASMVSGFITAFNSMPLDIAKTRIQNLQMFETQTSSFCLINHIVKKEGFRALWKGFWPCYGRIGPYTIITFVVNEQLNRLYRLHYMK